MARHHVRRLAAITAVAIAVGACGGDGTPSADSAADSSQDAAASTSTTPADQTSRTTARPTSSSGSKDPAKVDPCALVTKAEAAGMLGSTLANASAETAETDGIRLCTYKGIGPSGERDGYVIVGVFAKTFDTKQSFLDELGKAQGLDPYLINGAPRFNDFALGDYGFTGRIGSLYFVKSTVGAFIFYDSDWIKDSGSLREGVRYRAFHAADRI